MKMDAADERQEEESARAPPSSRAEGVGGCHSGNRCKYTNKLYVIHPTNEREQFMMMMTLIVSLYRWQGKVPIS